MAWSVIPELLLALYKCFFPQTHCEVSADRTGLRHLRRCLVVLSTFPASAWTCWMCSRRSVGGLGSFGIYLGGEFHRLIQGKSRNVFRFWFLVPKMEVLKVSISTLQMLGIWLGIYSNTRQSRVPSTTCQKVNYKKVIAWYCQIIAPSQVVGNMNRVFLFHVWATSSLWTHYPFSLTYPVCWRHCQILVVSWPTFFGVMMKI